LRLTAVQVYELLDGEAVLSFRNILAMLHRMLEYFRPHAAQLAPTQPGREPATAAQPTLQPQEVLRMLPRNAQSHAQVRQVKCMLRMVQAALRGPEQQNILFSDRKRPLLEWLFSEALLSVIFVPQY
jgi:hypothetical protein